VWLIQEGKALKRPVVVGARDEARGVSQVTTGLQGGEQVIAAPGEVTEGMSVQVGTVTPEKDTRQ
jgi:hypothetical protein